MPVRLLLVEDHQIVREGLKAVLEQVPDFEVVGEAADGLAALQLVESLQPNMVLLDLMLPNLSGLEVVRHLGRKFPHVRVIILSMHSDPAYVTEAMRAGATGYVLKSEGASELIHAIREADAGRQHVSPAIPDAQLSTYTRRAADVTADLLHALTEREREILQMTAEGLSGSEIAQKLFISPRTVESHRANLMKKLGVRNQRELVRFAVQHGLTTPVL